MTCRPIADRFPREKLPLIYDVLPAMRLCLGVVLTNLTIETDKYACIYKPHVGPSQGATSIPSV